MSLASDRSFCCAIVMFSTLWQDAICHSNELLCGKKRSQGTFLKMSGSRECKVCNTVNSSGPALQARGLPVHQLLTGTIHAKLRQGIENKSRILSWRACSLHLGKTWQTQRRHRLPSVTRLGFILGRHHRSYGEVYSVYLYILCSVEQRRGSAGPLFKSQRHPKCPWLMLLARAVQSVFRTEKKGRRS